MDQITAFLENTPSVKLTKKERSLLEALLNGKISRAEILTDVFAWSPTFASKATHTDTRCVDMLVSRLRKKIAPIALIVSNRGVGYQVILRE